MQQLINAPQYGFSLQFVDAAARHVDWSDYCEGDDFTLILPPPTCADVRDNAPDLAAEWWPGDDAPADGWDSPLCDSERDEFEESDGFAEWLDGFAPMMNYAWPVAMAYNGPDAETAAALIEKLAGACVLIELGEDMATRLYGDDNDAPDYVIALTGGGMDLSDHIAAAYLACGCVPPWRLLTGLSGVFYADSVAKARALPLRQAYADAADAFRSRADRLLQECGRIFGGNTGRRMEPGDLGLESFL